jgi:release factor glutamine methyltransferase
MRMKSADKGGCAWSVARLLHWTRDYLHQGGIESPRLCAEILLAHAMQCERIQLYTRFEEVPAEPILAAFRALVKQAATGYPIAYITGIKEFFSLPFEVTPDVLIPRPETEILVERTIDLVRKTPDDIHTVLDLGTGSGCIAVSLARHLPGVRVLASDISEAALLVSRRNAARHALAERIEFRCGDLFEPWTAVGADRPRFDVIVCNPPYVATAAAAVAANVRNFEPHIALFAGPEGLDAIHRIVCQAPTWLAAGGHLLLEIGYDQAPAVRDLLARPPWTDIVTYRDGVGHERVVHARSPR